MAEPRKSSILFFLRRCFPLLEHLQHSISHHEAAEDVRRAKDNGDESERVQQRRVGCPSYEKRTQYHDSMNRVRSGHQRRMQHRGNATDHLEANEDRHDEHVDAEHQLLTHRTDSRVDCFSEDRPSRRRVGSCRTWPSAVITTASMMSSWKLRLSSPLGASSVTSAATFLAYI